MSNEIANEEYEQLNKSLEDLLKETAKDSFFEKMNVYIKVAMKNIKNSTYYIEHYGLSAIARQEQIYKDLSKYGFLKNGLKIGGFMEASYAVYQKQGIEKAKEMISLGAGVLVTSILLPHAYRLGGTPLIKQGFATVVFAIGNIVTDLTRNMIDATTWTAENITTYLLEKGYLNDKEFNVSKLIDDAKSLFSSDRDRESFERIAKSFLDENIELSSVEVNFDIDLYSDMKSDIDSLNITSDLPKELKSSFYSAETTRSPLILDLDGNGVETVSVNDGVYFDHDGNGFAEKSGWVSENDGILVRDLNNNGQIDGGNELFGDQTLLSDDTKAANGFEALAA